MSQASGIRILQVACLVSIFGSATVGCAPEVSEFPAEESEPRVVEPFELPDLTFRWSATDDVDLDMPEVEVVRAYAESEALHSATGDPDVTYTGYQDALRYELEDDPTIRGYLGTLDFRVLDVRDAVDSRGRDSMQIAVCKWRNHAALRWPDGEWRMGSEWGYFRTYRVSAVSGGTAEHPRFSDGGRRARPGRNVFDGWSVETSQFVLSLASAAELGLSDIKEGCDTGRVTETDRQEPIIVPGPPEPLPFDPGWLVYAGEGS